MEKNIYLHKIWPFWQHSSQTKRREREISKVHTPKCVRPWQTSTVTALPNSQKCRDVNFGIYEFEVAENAQIYSRFIDTAAVGTNIFMPATTAVNAIQTICAHQFCDTLQTVESEITWQIKWHKLHIVYFNAHTQKTYVQHINTPNALVLPMQNTANLHNHRR